MIKGLDGPKAPYEPNKRSDNWLKVRRGRTPLRCLILRAGSLSWRDPLCG